MLASPASVYVCVLGRGVKLYRGREKRDREIYTHTLTQSWKKEKQQTGVISRSALDGRACTACETSDVHTYRKKKKREREIEKPEQTSRQLQEFLLTSSDDATYSKCFVLHRNLSRHDSVRPLTSEINKYVP